MHSVMPEYTGDMWIYGFDITQNKSSFFHVQDKDLSGLCWGNHSRRRKDYISHFLFFNPFLLDWGDMDFLIK